jgi:hypothetical protein
MQYTSNPLCQCSTSLQEWPAGPRHLQHRVGMLCCCHLLHFERSRVLWDWFWCWRPLPCTPGPLQLRMLLAQNSSVYVMLLHRFYDCDGNVTNGCEVQTPPNTNIQCNPDGGFSIAGCAGGCVLYLRLGCQCCSCSITCYVLTG